MGIPSLDQKATDGTTTVFNATNASAQLLPSNPRRVKFFIENPAGGAGTLSVRFGAVAAAVAVGGHAFNIPPGVTYESYPNEWSGPIQAILSMVGPRAFGITETF